MCEVNGAIGVVSGSVPNPPKALVEEEDWEEAPHQNKSLYESSTDPFPFPSSDHTHDDKVSCMPDSLIQFPTLLSIREAQKVRVRP